MFKKGGYDKLLEMLDNPMGYISGMLSYMDERNKQRAKEEAGITYENGFYGLTRLNIPFKYYNIDIKNGYFYCYTDEKTEVYEKEGKFLFSGTKIHYYEQGLFLVGIKPDDNKNDEYGFSLYNEDVKLTEPIFQHSGMYGRFNEQGFTIVRKFGTSNDVVINKLGEIKHESSTWGSSNYLHGAILSTQNHNINLLTGDIICEKGYDTMYSKQFLFSKINDNCIYQINIHTGDYVIHGDPPQPKEEPKYEPTPAKKTEPKPKEQGRNELCNCGSGKKYKNCCLNKNI